MQTDIPIAGSKQSSLAMMGGKSIRANGLTYGHQTVDDDDVLAVAESLRVDLLTQGTKIQEFGKAIAKQVGVKHAVCIANSTAALHPAYYVAGVSAGEIVVTTPSTVFDALRKENIGVPVHYIPTYKMPYYQDNVVEGDWSKLCLGAEEFYSREICLPIFPSMIYQDFADVLTALDKIKTCL